MIRAAKSLQENFAQLLVPSPLDAAASESTTDEANGTSPGKTYVIDALLDLTLNSNDQSPFDLRFAACQCLKSYFSNHSEVRLHFLARAIDGYEAVADESANILTVLLRPDADTSARDPYRQWFASVIAFHLLHDNPTSKTKLLAVTEGDATKGEEVVTSIQTVTAHLITGISRGDDARILVGYLMLLLGWMFEDLEAVNDFLAEGSNVQSLIQAVSQPSSAGGDLVQGLCATLLGVAYEFSTKDSPLSRTNFHSILSSRLDRERYLDRLTRLRSHQLVREFEVVPQKQNSGSVNALPEIYFDAVFVDFFKDNYSRMARAIDRAPELEISVVTNGIQKGISRELVDSLRSQLEEKDRVLDDVHNQVTSLEQSLRQQDVDNRHSREESSRDISKLEASLAELEKTHATQLRSVLTIPWPLLFAMLTM